MMASVPTTVTVIAAACNESVNAREWVEHLDWVHRIVVVDTGSRDDTVEQLREAGAEVHCLNVEGAELIHRAKNLALEQVDAGWVLDLDLDERVSPQLQAEIRVLANDQASYAAYRVPFRHYVFGRWLEHGGWCDHHLRLFRAGRVRYPEDRAHSTPEIDGEVGTLTGEVLHFAHPTLHDFLVKMNRYTTQDAPLMLEHGRGGLRNRPPLRAKPGKWIRAALSVFWNRYVKHKGYRDGVPGFLVAALLGAYVHVEQAKVWERQHAGSGAAGHP